jgi:hypothetical protein
MARFQCILILAFCAGLLSCDRDQPVWRSLQVSTDKETYGVSDTVVVTLFNPSGATAHVITWCSRVHYGIYLADSDHFYAGYPHDCGEVSNVPIGAGTSINDSLPLSNIVMQNGRFYLSVSYWLDIGELRNPVIALSNKFNVIGSR